MFTTRTLLLCLALAGSLLPFGCGSPKGWTAVRPVGGTVLYKGQPAVDVQISFHPVGKGEGPKLPSAFAKTDARGRFVLRTFSDNDGAAPGEFVVLLTKTIDENAAASNPDITATQPKPKYKELLPAFLGLPGTTPLRVTVPSDRSSTFEISLGDTPKECSIKSAG